MYEYVCILCGLELVMDTRKELRFKELYIIFVLKNMRAESNVSITNFPLN
jgi:hypothetical protein